MAARADYWNHNVTARDLLPGVRYHRHLLFRCSLRWTKP